jgi:hypothetical protein
VTVEIFWAGVFLLDVRLRVLPGVFSAMLLKPLLEALIRRMRR